ncbi:MAG: hypothetical protein CMC13_00375 [Flavobacteriaceae bacterium]|nr:hypothetical protein [Flavobacteriaceae bacterium]|tara:strand:- start:29553 stop:29762 length:210 start_codon:yes stop_codon:yes gene_type:complete
MSRNLGQSSGRKERREILNKPREFNNRNTYKMKVVNWGRGQIKRYVPNIQLVFNWKKMEVVKITHWVEK